jgi:hypothetical protein
MLEESLIGEASPAIPPCNRERIQMKRSLSCLWRIGFLGLVCIVMTAKGQAWERPPVKIDTHWEFSVNVKYGPDTRRPVAPWYAYFPVDPRMTPSAQTTPYPPWPATFPPQASPPIVPKEAPRQAFDGNAPRDTQASYVWPNQTAYGMNVQPVGYVPAQAPSYWYRNP